MATFADFVLLRAVPSYGGAEVLRARRVLVDGEGAVVHLALLGDDEAVAVRVAAVAEIASLAAHDRVARIHEVGRYEGEGYAVADAVDGVDLAALLEQDRRSQVAPAVALSLAIAYQLALLAVELQERGDVWAAEGGAGLSALFPSGLRLDSVVLGVDGNVTVRVLAGAGHDAARTTIFHAPELRHRRPSASSDVFLVTQLLRALLSEHPVSADPPRLVAGTSSLTRLLAAGMAASPDERLGLFMLVERLAAALSSATPGVAAGGSMEAKAFAVVAAGLEQRYRSLGPDGGIDPPIATAAMALRARLADVRASLQVMWPVGHEEASRSLPPVASPYEVVATSHVPMVFTDIEDSRSETVRGPRGLRRPQSAPVLDIAALTELSEESTTQTRAFPADQTFEARSDPPWLASSDAALVEASVAPLVTPSEIEGEPTTETHVTFADDETNEALPRKGSES